jgi:hypothetical protein
MDNSATPIYISPMKSIPILLVLMLCFRGIAPCATPTQDNENFPQIGSFYILRSEEKDLNGKIVKVLKLNPTDPQWAKVSEEDNTVRPPRLEAKWINLRSLSGAQQTGQPADWPRPEETHLAVKTVSPGSVPLPPSAPIVTQPRPGDYYVDGKGNEYLPGYQPTGTKLVRASSPN